MADTQYRIGEAARLLQLKSYVLRFWESEFPQIAPKRTASGQRLYSEDDIAVLRCIQHLLHNQGMTLDGAKRVLEQATLPKAQPASVQNTKPLPQAETVHAVLDATAKPNAHGNLEQASLLSFCSPAACTGDAANADCMECSECAGKSAYAATQNMPEFAQSLAQNAAASAKEAAFLQGLTDELTAMRALLTKK